MSSFKTVALNLIQISTDLIENYFETSNKSSKYNKAQWIEDVVFSKEFDIKKTLNIIKETKESIEYNYWIVRSKKKETLPFQLFIDAQKSRPDKKPFQNRTTFINEIIACEKEGLGIGKKSKIVFFLNEVYAKAIKIEVAKSPKTIIEALKKGFISYNDLDLFIENSNYSFKTKYKKIELAGLVLPEKHREVLICLLQGLSNLEAGKKTQLTRERVRQIGLAILKNEKFRKAIKYYELQTDFFQSKGEDSRDLFVASKDFKRKTDGLKNKRVGPIKKLFLDEVEEVFYNQNHVYYDIYKNQPQNIKQTFRFLIKSYYLKKDIFLLFEKELDSFYNNLFLKDTLIEKKNYSKDFLDFIEEHKVKVFDLKIVHFSKQYIYIGSKTSVPFLVELAIKKSEKPTKTLRIKEIYNWIKTNFPQKKITSIEGIRGAILGSKNIITFGKTGNYGLAKDYGVKKSSDLSTKNLIIELLKKNENPLTEDVIENYVMDKNPFLKERSVPMIIEINPKTFKKISFTDGKVGNKTVGRSYIGLVDRKYPEHPKRFSSKELREYLKSKDLEQEWLSFTHIKKKLDIPKYQLRDILLRKNYLIHEDMITLSTSSPAADGLIIKLVKNQSLIKQVGVYLTMNISEKTIFKKKMAEIIKNEYSIKLKNNHISKIINFII